MSLLNHAKSVIKKLQNACPECGGVLTEKLNTTITPIPGTYVKGNVVYCNDCEKAYGTFYVTPNIPLEHISIKFKVEEEK